MKTVKRLTFITILIVVGMLSFVGATTALPKQGDGKIRGTILDVNDARVANANIKIEGNKIKRNLKSDGEGQFEISLPEGSYQITVEANGFRRFLYSSLKVHANETEMINIHVVVAVYSGLVPASQ